MKVWSKEKRETEVAAMTAHLDPTSERFRRTVRELERSDQPGVRQMVDHRHDPNHPTFDIGVPAGMVEVRAGLCPCSMCGHEFMWECHDADCRDCTSTCN